MGDQALSAANTTGRKQSGSAASLGLRFPRTYDLLLRVMTRGREQQYRNDVLELARIAQGHRVLDIGCGTGTQAIATYRRVQPEGSVIGVDISENMLAAAQRKARRAGADVAFLGADAIGLPFEGGTFDVVTITTVMHMIPPSRRRLCLAEAVRVLKRGGRLLLIDYAGTPDERSHWTARHGRHGFFDLQSLKPNLSDIGLGGMDGGPLNWLSLHFLRGTKT